MTLGELRQELANVVQHPSYTEDDELLTRYLNEAYIHAVDRAMIPDFKRVDTVNTVVDQAYANISTISTYSFSGRLLLVNGGAIEILKSLEELNFNYPDMTLAGPVAAVALEGNILWYQKVPATPQTLSIVYYAYPPEMVDDEDVPEAIPVFLQRRILVHRAASFIFDQIEDGVEGQKVNTAAQRLQANNAMQELFHHLGKNRMHKITSTYRY